MRGSLLCRIVQVEIPKRERSATVQGGNAADKAQQGHKNQKQRTNTTEVTSTALTTYACIIHQDTGRSRGTQPDECPCSSRVVDAVLYRASMCCRVFAQPARVPQLNRLSKYETK